MTKRLWIVFALGAALAAGCAAQEQEDHGGLVAGLYGSGSRVMGGGGGFLGVYGSGPFPKPIGGVFVELGLAGPTPKTPVDGVSSFNVQSACNLRRHADKISFMPGFAYLTGGYSRLFRTGNGVNYGGGFIWRIANGKNSDFKSLRLEYRETFVPNWGRQPGVRVAWEWGTDGD